MSLSLEKKHTLFFAPGNGATLNLGRNIELNSYESLAFWAKENLIDLTIVGPEVPLVEGIVDIFQNENLTIFGPNKINAKLEGSKVYAKKILNKYNIPTANSIETNNTKEALEFAKNKKVVIKADGLCAGKGVIIPADENETEKTIIDMLENQMFKEASKNIVVEEYLEGFELSVFVLCDSNGYKYYL